MQTNPVAVLVHKAAQLVRRSEERLLKHTIQVGLIHPDTVVCNHNYDFNLIPVELSYDWNCDQVIVMGKLDCIWQKVD